MTVDLSNMIWLNEPQWEYDGRVLTIHTAKETDFWQRTHYGFQRDNGHALLKEVTGPFHLRARFRFSPNAQYDQCGLLLREDENCWFKCSVEYEDERLSRLGSVLTNGGYSDWATQDISSAIREITYDVEFTHSDIVAQYSFDGVAFTQMRVGHLAARTNRLWVGLYGCSPVGDGFQFEVLDLIQEAIVL
jgi:uncharacterized protein